MTATDELRKLLDERGVEYIDNDDDRDEIAEPLTTTWEYIQCGYEMVVTATEARDVENKPYLDMDFHHYFTPEQAIAATLGRGTCRSTTPDDAWCFACSECGKSFPRNELHLANNHGEINYCPNCGARVERREQ